MESDLSALSGLLSSELSVLRVHETIHSPKALVVSPTCLGHSLDAPRQKQHLK